MPIPRATLLLVPSPPLPLLLTGLEVVVVDVDVDVLEAPRAGDEVGISVSEEGDEEWGEGE